MTEPTIEQFRDYASTYSIVPVWRHLLADMTTPVAAFARIVGDGDGFLFESVEHGERWSRWSFVGRNPLAKIVAHGRELQVEGELPVAVPLSEGVLAAIESLLDQCKAPEIDDLPPLHGGLVGYLGYDVVREVEHLPDAPPADTDKARRVPPAETTVRRGWAMLRLTSASPRERGGWPSAPFHSINTSLSSRSASPHNTRTLLCPCSASGMGSPISSSRVGTRSM
ncbi:MAG: hypothetical protein IH940_12765 [Acidobacteria bacterium]|nr:hypothetical protein [Acidobacteriota bacterium]